MPRFLFASDSFKGTISSARAAELLADAARQEFADAAITSVEVADGGEGTVDAVVAAAGGRLRSVEVAGPLQNGVRATYGILDDGRAIIEMAAAAGLPLLAPHECDPRRTSTFGVGQLIRDALDEDVRDITLAIGGSATNDGGMGCMRALGARFVDSRGVELAGVGEDLARVASIDLGAMDSRLGEARFCVMCDVDNPLLGKRGATRVFGPQKGATAEVVDQLEHGMQSYADVLTRTFRGFDPDAAGMGAAGGLGAAARVFFGAELVPGIERVLELMNFDCLLRDCDLCVTGEGHADAQSAHGKVVSGVAQHCLAAGVPCVALVGGMSADACELLNCGVDALVPTVMDVEPLERVLLHAERNYAFAAQRLFSLLRLGGKL